MSDSAALDNRWSEDNSAAFLELAEIFVPGRIEQTETLLGLIPATQDETFTIVELASGEGMLAEAIMEHFPRCHYIALDGSILMRERTWQRLDRFKDRLEVRDFSIASPEWRSSLPQSLRCVLSSLCVHHLSAAEKRQLFKDMKVRLEPGGALLLADILEPDNQQVAKLFAQQYDDIVREQSLASKGDLSSYEQFHRLQWNYFTFDYGTGQTFDQPSTLQEQLRWLLEVGFKLVDCFWMRAGHAVYGGFKA